MSIFTKDILSVATSVSFFVLMLTLVAGFQLNSSDPKNVIAKANPLSTQSASTDDSTVVSNADLTTKEGKKGKATETTVKNESVANEKQKDLLAQASAENVQQFTEQYKQLASGKEAPIKTKRAVNNAATLATLLTIKN